MRLLRNFNVDERPSDHGLGVAWLRPKQVQGSGRFVADTPPGPPGLQCTRYTRDTRARARVPGPFEIVFEYSRGFFFLEFRISTAVRILFGVSSLSTAVSDHDDQRYNQLFVSTLSSTELCG